MVKTKILWTLVLVMAIASAPAFAGEATQIWKCEMEDDATEAQVLKGAQEWLAAAKKMKGGENLQAYVYFPVAVNMTGDSDVMFVISTPTFTEWGQFWDGYMGSPAAKVDKANEAFVICPDSAVWETVKIK